MKRTIGIAFGAALAVALLIACGAYGMRGTAPATRPEPGIGIYGGGPRTRWEGYRPRTDPPDTGPQSRF